MPPGDPPTTTPSPTGGWRGRGRGGGARVRLVLQLEGGLRLRPAPPAARGHHRPRHLRRLGRAARRGALALGELALGVHAGPRATKIEHFFKLLSLLIRQQNYEQLSMPQYRYVHIRDVFMHVNMMSREDAIFEVSTNETGRDLGK